MSRLLRRFAKPEAENSQIATNFWRTFRLLATAEYGLS
jgi:hypothetical protein